MKIITTNKGLGYYDFEIYSLNMARFADGKLEDEVFGLDYITIHREYRGNGYGSILLKHIESEMKKIGAKKIRGEFIPQDRTPIEVLRKFYEDNGYKIERGYVEKDLI
ncbi:MAG: GNAT family N-acetyltransferase [Clostridium celatum]|nr:GNAT family N-acetyltransferase [Clostridium celatum]